MLAERDRGDVPCVPPASVERGLEARARNRVDRHQAPAVGPDSSCQDATSVAPFQLAYACGRRAPARDEPAAVAGRPPREAEGAVVLAAVRQLRVEADRRRRAPNSVTYGSLPQPTTHVAVAEQPARCP